MPRAEPPRELGAASELVPLLRDDSSRDGEPNTRNSTDRIEPTASWPVRLYYFMFCVLILLQTLRVVSTDWRERDASGCEPIWWAMCLRYFPVLAAAVVHLWVLWDKPESCCCSSLSQGALGSKAVWKAGPTAATLRLLSTATIFYTGLAKFDFGHCVFFMLGLRLALFGIHSQSIVWVSHLCKLTTFFVYCMNFPWVDQDPGMWAKSFGITSFNTCEDIHVFSYTWRTFGWPMLAVTTTLCWEKAMKERLAASQTRRVARSSQSDERIENLKHLCATAVLLATVYARDGSTILRAVTLFLAGIMLTWKRTTLCGCRKYAMEVTRVWLVAIIVAKYCYKSVLFRVMFGTHVFSKDEMLNWLGAFLEWAPEYSPRDLLNDIGLVTRPPDFWSASGGAISDILPELVALVLIGDLLRLNNSTDAIQTDSVQLLVATIDEFCEYIAEHCTDVLKWCRHHVQLFREDITQAVRLVCITMVFWMGTYELTLFNFMYFVTGTALTFRWGHCSTTAWCSSVFTDVCGKVLPLVHLTSVYVWKLEFLRQVLPDSSDGSIIPLDRIETIFGCDATQTFTWIGFRGVVMRKVGEQYVAHTSTYVPFVVMISLAVYNWLDPGDGDGEAEKTVDEEEQKHIEEEQRHIEKDSKILKAAALIRDKYLWIRDMITDGAFIVPVFYALLIWTPVLRGQVDLVSGMYLFLLFCFTLSQRKMPDIAPPLDGPDSTCQSFAKSICHCVSRYQMGLLAFVLCARYLVYLGLPPDCGWLPPPGHLITRNRNLRVWLGIANECVTEQMYYQPCAVEDLLNDFAILLSMACYTRWTTAADARKSILVAEDGLECKAQEFSAKLQKAKLRELRNMSHRKLLALAERSNEPGPSTYRSSIEMGDQEDLGLPRYGNGWFEHLRCLFWESAGVFVFQTVLLYLLVCQWAATNIPQRVDQNDAPQAETQGTSIWMCLATWLLLRTFRHETTESAKDAETIDTDFDTKKLKELSKELFRLACGTMFLYAMTQPPLGTKFLEWIDWTFQTTCETRVWKALMILFGIPLQTIELESASVKDTSYLTILATTALLTLGLKSLLREPTRQKVMKKQYELNKITQDLGKSAFYTANFIWREAMFADDEERTSHGRGRKGSIGTVGTVSSWFEHIYTKIHNNWIDNLIHVKDSDAVRKSARAVASQTELEPRLSAESRDYKIPALLLLGVLLVILLSALGWFIYKWTSLLGSIYFIVMLSVLFFVLLLVFVKQYEVSDKISKQENDKIRDWIFAVIRREPHWECKLDEEKFKWLAKKLHVDPSGEFEKAGTHSIDVERNQSNFQYVSIDEFMNWYEGYNYKEDCDIPEDIRIPPNIRRYCLATVTQLFPGGRIQKLVRNRSEKSCFIGKSRKEWLLQQRHQKTLVEKIPEFRDFQAELARISILDNLPKFLTGPARQFDDLANSIAFALANLLGIARMCWFVLVGRSVQLCCMLICMGFIEHRDLVSCVLMTSLFGYYFDAATDHSARCKYWCSAVDVVQLRMLTAQLVTAVPPFVLVAGCLFWSLGTCRSPLNSSTSRSGDVDHDEFRLATYHLPPALLIIGLQGLLGALVWPAIILLAISAYLGSNNTKPSVGTCVNTCTTFVLGFILLLFGVAVIGVLFVIMGTGGLWWGTAWVAIVCIVVCYLVAQYPTLFKDELGKPAMCFAYTLLLASFWGINEMILPLIFGVSPTKDPFSWQTMCERLYQPDGTEWSGHVLDMSVSGWDLGLFLALLLHRHRLRRRDEWKICNYRQNSKAYTTAHKLNGDLKDLTNRPFSLLPPIVFWNRALIDPLKQTLAVWVPKDIVPESPLGIKIDTWKMVSGVVVLAAATLSMMCVFDDIPAGLNENTGGLTTIKWTGQQDVGSCLSTSMTFIKVMTCVILFFSAFGLLSWATRVKLETSNTVYGYAVIDYHQEFNVIDFAEKCFHTDLHRCLIILVNGRKQQWHVHGTWRGDQTAHKEYPHPGRKGEGHSKTVRVAFDTDDRKGFQYICKKDAVQLVHKWHITDEEIDNEKRRKVPYDDGYVPMLGWQLIALPLVVALYFQRTGQSASQISQSVTQSSTIPTSIVALGCGVFVLIIVDRVVYMFESSTCKRLLLWVSMLAYSAFWVTSASDTDDQSTDDQSELLMIACSMYFYQSAIMLERKLKRNPQRRFIRYDKVPGDQNTWVHTFRGPIRKVPFLMELVYLIDWLSTRTALSLACYIRVEEIYTSLYEKQEQIEQERKGEEKKQEDTKPYEQTWKVSAQNERCKWCCGLVLLVIVLWGPLFAYSSSDILGDCNRPDPDGCTVDTYTLWSTKSAKLRGITSAADMYGPFQSKLEQSNRATNRIQRQLEETYRYDQFQLLMIGSNNASSGWSITSHARDELLNSLEKPTCEEASAGQECTSLSTRLSYTFSRTSASQQEEISGHAGWQTVHRDHKKLLHSLVQQISDGDTGRIASVKSIVKYPLYLGLPATGVVRPDIVRSDILGTSLTKTVELSWSYAGLTKICDGNHAAASPHDQMCIAGETFRNASVGADLGWFTLKSSCPIENTNFDGLCFILANDKIAAADNEITTTLLASADKLGLVGFYTIAVLSIGNYIRRLVEGEFQDATQRRLHHDPDCVNTLMEFCENLVAARSAPLYDFEEELRIYKTYFASGKHVWEAMQQDTTPTTDMVPGPELNSHVAQEPEPQPEHEPEPEPGPWPEPRQTSLRYDFGEIGESVEVEHQATSGE